MKLDQFQICNMALLIFSPLEEMPTRVAGKKTRAVSHLCGEEALRLMHDASCGIASIKNESFIHSFQTTHDGWLEYYSATHRRRVGYDREKHEVCEGQHHLGACSRCNDYA